MQLGDEVRLEQVASAALDTTWGSLGHSRAGSWCAARLHCDGTPLVTVVSVYADWERSVAGDGPIGADASAHRILSDLSPLLSQRDNRLLIAGDLNLLYGYGEHGNVVAKRRYQTVFDRAEALGLTYLGPRAPDGGRQPEPWHDEGPADSRTVIWPQATPSTPRPTSPAWRSCPRARRARPSTAGWGGKAAFTEPH